jgi:hemolysin III
VDTLHPSESAVEIRPRFRGLIHRWATPVGAALFVLLAVRADGSERPAMVVYGLCVTAMLGVSATYHSGRLSTTATRVFKRIDHATILFAIAGTYTAVTAVALEGGDRTKMLVVTWVAAGVGIALRMAWLDAPYPLVAVVYLAVGWLIVVDLPAYLRGMDDGPTALIVTGGLLYTVGGIVYAVHRPNPWPRSFGYHEVFHALVVAGASAHYLAVTGLVAAG